MFVGEQDDKKRLVREEKPWEAATQDDMTGTRGCRVWCGDNGKPRRGKWA